ncbi:hypothetical protein [Pseudonocardia sp. H11422]|uniref:hypothetical protein n=1 Tax=Pseudonocardia sp. H11422 TaxID=2835866 RepID=UPI001BDD68C5|nr:hypothetical protein [Pseudonocardia sp. H11422]
MLDVAGVANGELHSWFCGLDVRWHGLASFPILWASRNPSLGLTLVDQLVPAEALKPTPLQRRDVQTLTDSPEEVSWPTTPAAVSRKLILR